MIENKKIACIAVDDDPAALELLNSYISTVPFLQLYASFTSTIDVLPWLKENSTSLLFIEFNMPAAAGVSKNCLLHIRRSLRQPNIKLSVLLWLL